MENTPNLNLPYIAAAQAQKHVTHNEAIRNLDAIVHLSVLDRDLSAPPAVLSDGDRYIVASSASGEWTGREAYIAAWQDGAWIFHQPKEGWICWIADEGLALGWNGSNWEGISTSAGTNPTPLVGVNTTADATNKLAINSPASLFNHDGSDHRMVINKNSESDTASLLFQDNFLGRAEMGLAGNDDFSFKVSADSVVWKNAIEINRATGLVTFPETPSGGSNGTNLLINGDMTINQRSFVGGILAPGVYGFDRWKGASAGCEISVAGDVITLTSGAIEQIIEAPNLAGETLTISVEDLSGGDLDIDIEGEITTVLSGAGRTGATISVPGSSTGNISVMLSPASGAVTFKKPKLERGTASSLWVPRHIHEELALCQRYFVAGTAGATGGLSASTGTTGGTVYYPVHMRAIPTLTKSNETYVNVKSNNIIIGSYFALAHLKADCFGHYCINNSTGVAYSFDYTADAELAI